MGKVRQNSSGQELIVAIIDASDGLGRWRCAPKWMKRKAQGLGTFPRVQGALSGYAPIQRAARTAKFHVDPANSPGGAPSRGSRLARLPAQRFAYEGATDV